MLLSHLFVKLPIRTIAYRANLFSAVMAAVACVWRTRSRDSWERRAGLPPVRLSVSPPAQLLANGLIAEVYSLAAVTVALTIVLLLTWSARGGSAYLLAAVAAFSARSGQSPDHRRIDSRRDRVRPVAGSPTVASAR